MHQRGCVSPLREPRKAGHAKGRWPGDQVNLGVRGVPVASSDLRTTVSAQVHTWLLEEVDRICEITKQSRTSFIVNALMAETSRLTIHRGAVALVPALTPKAPKDAAALTPSQQAHFDIFWDEVPKKVAVGSAEKYYPRALRRAGGTEGEAASKILEGAKRWTLHVKATNTEAQYVKQPATWLNAVGWEDILSTDKWIGGSPVAAGPSDRSKREAAERARPKVEVLEEKLKDNGSLSQADEAALIRYRRVISEGNMSVNGDNMRKPATRRPQ